jgi:hypothetical protein
MTRPAQRCTVKVARVSAHGDMPRTFTSARTEPVQLESRTAMGIETIVIVVVIVLIVLFVVGYFGRGRRV